MNDAMEIVYAADHTFMFCCCVSLCSLMEHQPPEKTVRVHLLIDSSFCEEDERLLGFLTARFDHLHLVTHRVREELFEKYDFKDSLWSQATCYRLIVPWLLQDITRCLYLDSDTLIVGDLTTLWKTDLTGYCLAGVFEDISVVSAQTLGSRIPGIETYVNAGVLLMNLELMRELDLCEQLLTSAGDSMCPDQDSLNIACYGRIRLLPRQYNAIPDIEFDQPVIMHMRMRDYIRPWKNRRAAGADKWWDYAEQFAGLYDVESLRNEALWYEKGSISWIFRRCADFDKVYVVGAGQDADRIFRTLRLGKCRALREILREEDFLQYDPATLLICASRKREIPILREYLAHGNALRQVISFSRWPVSYHHLAPEVYKQELAAELLMWEFGADSYGMTTPTALLELNAVRYPEKEALVEWSNSRRRSVSFRELNRMANRMANHLRRSGIARGSRIELPALPESLLEFLIAMLGIMKGGYMVSLDKKGENTANISVLTEEGIPCEYPGAELLPDEPVLETGGRRFTARNLTGNSDRLRRRTGWHAQDIPAVYAAVNWHGILELTAALMYGNTVVLYPDAKPEEIFSLFSAEKISLASMSREMFCRVAELVSCGKIPDREQTPVPFRMVITNNCSEMPTGAADTGSDRYRDAARKWKARFPHIQVNAPGAQCYNTDAEEEAGFSTAE